MPVAWSPTRFTLRLVSPACIVHYFFKFYFASTVVPGPPLFSLTIQLRNQFPSPVTFVTGQRLLMQGFLDSASRTCTVGSATRPSSRLLHRELVKGIVVFFYSSFIPLDYEGPSGLGLGDPRPNAQALPLPSWASRRPPLSCEVHGRDLHHDCSISSRRTLAILSRNKRGESPDGHRSVW